MTEHLLEAYRVDFATRTNPRDGSGGQVAEGRAVNAHDVQAGMVYKDGNVTVTAFPTKHARELRVSIRYAGSQHRHLR